jgi:hypothetical protein
MKIKISAIIILLTAFLLGNLHFNKTNYILPDITKVFPKTLGEWRGSDLIVGKAVLEFIDKKEILLRKYELSGKALSLAVVLTQKRDHIHDPEVCYRGQGIIMDTEQNYMIEKNFIVKLVKGKRGRVPYNIIYWYTDLNRDYPERVVFMKNIAFSKLFDKPLKGFALVVIMAPANITMDSLKQFTLDSNKQVKSII